MEWSFPFLLSQNKSKLWLKWNNGFPSNLQPINYSHEYGGDDDPKQLEPVEEWDANELWSLEVIERRPEDDERDE
jgi:hypothetical protein